MKVGKEEIVGVLAAVETWTKLDLDALNKQWSQRVERIAKLVETVPGVTTEIKIPEGGNSYPTLDRVVGRGGHRIHGGGLRSRSCARASRASRS